MSYEGVFKTVKVSKDRIGSIVGKNGKVKAEIESRCNAYVDVDGETGDVSIRMKNQDSLTQSGVFKASEIVLAISKGFSPERAFRLLSDECILQLVDLREYSGKSLNSLDRIKSRLIGQNGKFRKNLEDFSGTDISIYGHFAGFIGTYDETSLALNAILMICKGSSHKSVYHMLEEHKRKKKLERLELWEKPN
ncbi:KH domain-containing protein [Candidatus Nitrosocosmicus franklandus]|uniref:KH domain protein n=1 Tax=Candidatus Nitrosocosmicus franklandianus TaxID=1798806 RepID=A0A484IA13_9ARCH|nr:KH domain-containing protein [Candidatus Nitrosocosmicus franklandus]VFJ13057.1 KH domain protein [Candidatus Nitrosocosmicus franklandus]